ncbi:MAG TPA: SAM-dependent methyltransferase [Streptosporangiaceae bacterium]|nr:SAM-dependent methyltransferase [Streptosporangiaceae bacterium]
MTDHKPRDIDVTTANVARIYDYFLGGKDNFAVDRHAAEQMTAMMPDLPLVARANRVFIGRAVRALAAEYGIRQFIDVGAGLPTQKSVHMVAQEIAPGTRVVYVDNDPVVCSHGRALLEGEASAMLEGDLRSPEAILDDPVTRELIDFSQPYALLLAAILHFVPDSEDPKGIIARFRATMAPGSALVISHGTMETRPDDPRARLSARVYRQASANLSLRSLDEVRELFDGFTLIEPGLVGTSEWRADGTEETDGTPDTMRGAVGVLP